MEELQKTDSSRVGQMVSAFSELVAEEASIELTKSITDHYEKRKVVHDKMQLIFDWTCVSQAG